MVAPVSEDVLDRLKAALGEGGWSQDPARLAPKLVEWRDRWSGDSPILLLPRSTQDVAKIVGICAETHTPITPQGGNTGLVGGQIPRGEVLLSLEKLNKVRDVSRADDVIIAEAGVTLAAVHEAATTVGRRFPLSLASEGSCTVGGNISTNAGGTAVLRFGNMRDLVLGIEAVLPNGQVFDGVRRLRKDNTGYDLKQLLIGAEGTLGVVTAASLKLFPLPASRAVAIAGLQTAQAAIDFLALAKDVAGSGLEAFELMSRLGMSLVVAHIPDQQEPMREHNPWYVLIEVTGETADGAEAAMGRVLEVAFEKGLIQDAVIAQSLTQMNAFWALRENQSAAQKAEGQAWKNDISVPTARIPEFIDKAEAALLKFCPGIRLAAFGHVGDGNLHFDVLGAPGTTAKDHLARREDAAVIVNGLVTDMDGSISAEHGIGVMKVEEALRYKAAPAIAAMRAVRNALDPNRIMNPRVLF